MVMIPAFQAGGPGSIPGRRIILDEHYHVAMREELPKVADPGFDPGTFGL